MLVTRQIGPSRKGDRMSRCDWLSLIKVEIPTLDGKVKIKVAEGTQSGKLLRVRGKGVTPVRTTMKGDLICRVVIETPVNLTREQKDLLRQFQDTLDGDSKHQQSPHKKSFFKKIGDLVD